jgi:hypothetical protein
MGVASIEIPDSFAQLARVHVPTSCAYRENPQRHRRVCVELLMQFL